MEGRRVALAAEIAGFVPVYQRSQAELDALASDPAHGGRIDAKSAQERRIGLELEARGDVPGPITRDPTGWSEFIDASGQKWDVKGFISRLPPHKGGFDVNSDAGKVDYSLSQAENVMVDTSKINQADIWP
jgi:hypothetical protein